MDIESKNGSEPEREIDRSEFDRFRDLLRRVIDVPKEEVDALRAGRKTRQRESQA